MIGMFRRRQALLLSTGLVVAMWTLSPPGGWVAPARAQKNSGAENADQEIERRREELLKLKQQIVREQAAAEKLRGRERRVLEEIQAVDRQLTTIKSYLKKLAEQERAIRSRLGQLELEISARGGELDQVRSRLGVRVREMYKAGQPQMLEFLFSSYSLPDLFNRLHFMLRLADEDRRTMGSISGTRRALLSDKTEVEQRFVELRQIEQEKQREEQRLGTLRRQRESHGAKLGRQRQAHEGAASELREAEERLQSLIQRLERRRRTEPEFVPPSGPFAQAKGKLPWPARGRVTSGFGMHTHPQFGTATQNNGIDIEAGVGTAVHAVAEGKVDFRDWLTGYGNCIILNHGAGYYTLYAHLSEVTVAAGAQVAAGAVIGRSGETGTLKGPILHFEVRRGASAMDPLGWLAR